MGILCCLCVASDIWHYLTHTFTGDLLCLQAIYFLLSLCFHIPPYLFSLSIYRLLILGYFVFHLCVFMFFCHPYYLSGLSIYLYRSTLSFPSSFMHLITYSSADSILLFIQQIVLFVSCHFSSFLIHYCNFLI